MFNHRWFYFFLVLLVPSFASAEEYYWERYTAPDGKRYSSAVTACESHYPKTDPYDTYTYGGIKWTNASSVQCQGRRASNGNVFGQFSVVRRGTSCAPGSTYDSTTGGCNAPEPDLCAEKAGSSFPFKKANSQADNYVTVNNGYGIPSTEACFNGCAASTTDQKCTINTSGSYRCAGTAYYTGSKCTSAVDVDFSDFVEKPDPETTSKEEPCQYIQGADGVLRCDSEFTTQKEGQFCGEVNGVKTCVDAKPTKNGVEISTEVKTETDADGGTTTTKTDTATHTECKGVNDCKSTTTTTTTTIKKDAQGNTSSVTGTCTGPACADKDTNPDSDGDGYGDCVTGDCSSSGGSGEGWYEAGEDTYASVLGDFRDRVSDLPVTNGVGNFLSFNPSGSCPGSTKQVWVFTVQLDQWCGNDIPWSLIASVILGAAAMMSFRIAFL